MAAAGDFDALVADASAAPVDGWSFDWLDGRATEERPSWSYARSVLPPRIAGADALLDLQTGGGEVLAVALSLAPGQPATIGATESWAPNLTIARRTLAPWSVAVSAAADGGPLPFDRDSYDLVTSRHPVVVAWGEIARVLRPGGTYLSQQVGPDANRPLYEALMGPQPPGAQRSASSLRAGAAEAGLEVVRLVEERPKLVFYDIGAVVYFLRKVIWTVPDFSVAAYRTELRVLHERIERDGGFVSYAPRILLEAQKPDR